MPSSSAVPTADTTPPPALRMLTRANCDAPEKSTSESRHVCNRLRPAAMDTAPNETPNGATLTPTASARSAMRRASLRAAIERPDLRGRGAHAIGDEPDQRTGVGGLGAPLEGLAEVHRLPVLDDAAETDEPRGVLRKHGLQRCPVHRVVEMLEHVYVADTQRPRGRSVIGGQRARGG